MITTVENNQAIVRKALVSLNGVFKKILLYPSEHIICRNSLESFKKNLDHFFREYGDLGLKIERQQILYKDEVVHDGPMNEENPAFILFRDGIYHLEFKASIELWEMNSFMEILKQNKTLTEDAENDIVTALWELKLPNLRYKAEDVGFDACVDFEIPELGGEDASDEDPEQTVGNADGVEPVPFVNPLIPQRHLWEITVEDRERLQTMLVEV